MVHAPKRLAVLLAMAGCCATAVAQMPGPLPTTPTGVPTAGPLYGNPGYGNAGPQAGPYGAAGTAAAAAPVGYGSPAGYPAGYGNPTDPYYCPPGSAPPAGHLGMTQPPLYAVGMSPEMIAQYNSGTYGQLQVGQIPSPVLGEARLHQPTPTPGYGFDGVSDINRLTGDRLYNTIGIRLDKSYDLVREVETGVYLSESQHVFNGGVTILPYQSPCWIMGMRLLGGYVTNASIEDDTGALSIDLWGGTRYKSLYVKSGGFWDGQESWGKAGFTASFLFDPLFMDNMVIETAFGYGYGGPEIGPEVNFDTTGRFKVVDEPDLDMQVRFGSYLSQFVEAGISLHHIRYDRTYDEFNTGGYFNFYMGETRLGIDFTGGDTGPRGYVTLAYNWGGPKWQNLRDCNYQNVDTVAWLTRHTMRDVTVQLREDDGGPFPLPVAPGPIVNNLPPGI